MDSAKTLMSVKTTIRVPTGKVLYVTTLLGATTASVRKATSCAITRMNAHPMPHVLTVESMNIAAVRRIFSVAVIMVSLEWMAIVKTSMSAIPTTPVHQGWSVPTLMAPMNAHVHLDTSTAVHFTNACPSMNQPVSSQQYWKIASGVIPTTRWTNVVTYDAQ